jgi:hypothetical protein
MVDNNGRKGKGKTGRRTDKTAKMTDKALFVSRFCL